MGCWLSWQGPLPGQQDELSRVPKDLGGLDSYLRWPSPQNTVCLQLSLAAALLWS